MSASPDDEKAAERILGEFSPVLEAMSRDPRYKLNARMTDRRNILSNARPIFNMVYGHDSSAYFEGALADASDEELKKTVDELDTEISKLHPKDGDTDLDSMKVVAMTLSRFIISFGPEDVGDRRALDVDHVFVDEAGYCNCVQTAALFTLGVPVTMLGDHMQLPPVCEVNHKTMVDDMDDPLRRNDFLWDMSALYVDGIVSDNIPRLAELYRSYGDPDFMRIRHSSLTRTFRFGQNLAEVLAAHVYPEGMSSATSHPLEVEIIDARIDAFPMKEPDKAIRENSAEASAIDEYVRTHDLGDYVILTPYKDQIYHIRRNHRSLADHLLTIHKSQGREWDTVIVSVVDCHANPENSPRRFTTSRRTEEGYTGLKVINTAVSRAKRRLVIVCDTQYWMSEEGELIGDLVRANIRHRCDGASAPLRSHPSGDEPALLGQLQDVVPPVRGVPLPHYQSVRLQDLEVVSGVLLLDVEHLRHIRVGHLPPRLRLGQDVDEDLPGLPLDRGHVRNVGHGDLLQLVRHGAFGVPLHVVYCGPEEERRAASRRGHEVGPPGDVYREQHALRIVLVVDRADGVDDLLEIETGDVPYLHGYLQIAADVRHPLGRLPEPLARQEIEPVYPGADGVDPLRHGLYPVPDGGYVDVHQYKITFYCIRVFAYILSSDPYPGVEEK